MKSEGDIRSYTADQVRDMIARGEDRTDWEKVRAKTDAEIARDTADDSAWDGIPENWHETAVIVPAPKKLLSLRLDADVVEWFKQQGPGYQTRMNAVLKTFVSAHKKTA